LPGGAEAAPSLAVFKDGLDGAWSTLVWWKVPCPWQGGWNWTIYKVPSYSMTEEMHRKLF